MNYTYDIALPVKLVSFEAHPARNGQVDITWTTASENETDHFVIERSADGLRFDILANLPARNTKSLNRYNLTDRARGVVAEAANAAKSTGSARIEVSGHTDTVGSAQYNQALSMRRAESVAKELETRGIPRSQMVLQAFGFTRLLVPTGPNVREPQNRRVEIVLK